LTLTFAIDVGLQFDTPRGVIYLPSSLPPEPDKQRSFPETLNRDYINWLDTEEGKNRKHLGPRKRFDYRYFLQNPDTKSILEDAQDRRREANKKFYCLKNFELQDNQIYRKAEVVDSKYLPARYTVCTYDASDLVSCTYRNLLHASK
jgi:hypothetical protein